MSNAYPNSQWVFSPAYRPNGQSERDYNLSVEAPQNVQRSFSNPTRQGQQFSGNQYSQTTSPSNTAFTSAGGQYSNQTFRSRSADELYVPEQMQPSQNHYMNAFDVGNTFGATSRQGDFHTPGSSFGFPNSAGSMLSTGTSDSEATRTERMAAPYNTASPIPFQASFPQTAPTPSAQPSYFHAPSSQPITSLPPQSKRPRTDPATDEDEELTLDTKEDVKVKSRACQRCKNLKVKCEFKLADSSDPCKRCMNGGHDCQIPGKKKRRTPPKREHLMNQIREQAEHIRELMSQLEDANKKLRQPSVMSDISSQGSAPSPPVGFNSISPSSTSYQSLDGPDSETNKNITDWISKAKESFAEFDVFLNGGAGAPQSYFEDRDAEDSPAEDDVDNSDDDNDDYEFAVVASEGEEMNGIVTQKSSKVRRSSRSSVGSNLTRGSASGRKQEIAKKSPMVPNEAVPFGLMANLSIRKTRQRGASAEVEDVGVANDGFFARPGPGPAGAHEMPSILARSIITISEAEELFSIYFDRMNLSLSLVDPILYTAQNTCFRSPFMFTVICAIASRYYTKRSDLYDQLIVEAKMAAGAALIGGVKNVEMCIGFILLSLYPEPTRNWEDQRGWVYLGMAIRTAMDINLHLPNTAKPLNELHEREMLNRTRVWINCFNLDRSTGSQYGKLPIINNMDYTANHSEDWWRLSPYNMKNFDIHTSCYNAELRVMARFISRVYSDPKHPTGLNKEIDFAGIATETDEELKCLEAKWMAILDQTDMSDPQNRFRTGLLKLAFSYARLASLSFGFQHAFGKNRNNENPFLQRCLAAAYAVHDVILNDVGRPEQRIYLRHGPEAQIVFVTFASTFLIKLLQPKYATYIDAGQRSDIQRLVQGVIDLFGSPEVAVDERHGPKAYSRFLKGLLEVTLSEKVRQTSLPKIRRAKSAKSLNATEHSNPSSAYTSPVTTSMSIASSSPDVSMGYGFVPASMGTSLENSYGNPMHNFLTPDPEYFRPPLPFDDDILNSMQSLTDPDSWALPGFDWMSNYRASNS